MFPQYPLVQALVATTLELAGSTAYSDDPQLQPTHANVAYSEHAPCQLDIWIAEGDGPPPDVVCWGETMLSFPLVGATLAEWIESQGGNPFMDYSVPEAVLKLRQGVGRLIRSSRDRGMVAILDNRVVTRRYGRAFLDALPEAPIEIISQPPGND